MYLSVSSILKFCLVAGIFKLVCLQANTNRITPFLGKWKGHCKTKRSGVYGATIAEADTVSVLEFDDKGQLIQVCCSPTWKVAN